MRRSLRALLLALALPALAACGGGGGGGGPSSPPGPPPTPGPTTTPEPARSLFAEGELRGLARIAERLQTGLPRSFSPLRGFSHPDAADDTDIISQLQERVGQPGFGSLPYTGALPPAGSTRTTPPSGLRSLPEPEAPDERRVLATLERLVPRREPSEAAAYLSDPRFRAQPHLAAVKAHHAYARGARGTGVRIGISDTPFDVAHPEFRGRVLPGTLTYLRPLAFLPASEAFAACPAAAGGCRVWEIDTRDSDDPDAEIQRLAHRIALAHGQPEADDTWFIRDLDGSDFGAWYEIPALAWRRPPPSGSGHVWPESHGTNVASTAAGWLFGVAPGALLVPLATSFDRDEERELGIAAQTFLFLRRRAGEADADLDAEAARLYREEYEQVDILNMSWSLREQYEEESNFPMAWRAFLQQDTPDAEKTVIVRSAGNVGSDSGDTTIPRPSARLPYHEPLARGHQLAAVGVQRGADGIYRISSYSHRCGGLPLGWDPALHGRHYCIAALFHGRAFNPGATDVENPEDHDVAPNFGGTSLAAPMVSGGIALVLDLFRNQLNGPEAARRIVDTADNTGIYADSDIYGAGLMDLDAATRPIGAPVTGTQRRQAEMAETWIELPSFYGAPKLDGVEVAGFDEWGAPFWVPASALVRPGPSPGPSPVPEPPAGPETRGGGSVEEGPLPGLRWSEAGEAPGALRMGIREAESPAGGPAFGASLEALPGIRLGLLAEDGAGLAGRSSGAFGAPQGSRMAYASGRAGRALLGWQAEASWTVAAGRPLAEEGTMLEMEASVFTAGRLSLERRAQGSRTVLSLEQPLRAETGAGTLRHAVGRTKSGRRLYAETEFPLAPDGREAILGIRHERPLGPGTLALEAALAREAGHVPDRERARIGASWTAWW